MAVTKWQRRRTLQFGETWVPFARVDIQASTGRYQTFALQVDSGAVVSLLRRSAADLLGIDLETGRRIRLTSVGGAETVAYVHDLTVRFDPRMEYAVPFAIAANEAVPNLLGRLRVFDSLQVDFDATLKETRITGPWLDEARVLVCECLAATERHILSRWDDLGWPAPAPEAAHRFVNRAGAMMVDVVGLVKMHRAYSAPMFIRAFFELALQFEYLLEDPEPRAQRYLEFAHILRHQTSQAIVRDSPGPIARSVAERLSHMDGDVETRNRKEFDRVEPMFTHRDRHGREHLARNWYGMSLKDLADKLGRAAEYRLWYDLTSEWFHASPFSTESDRAYGGREASVVLPVCWCYYARMLLQLADHIVLPADQYKTLKKLAEGIT